MENRAFAGVIKVRLANLHEVMLTTDLAQEVSVIIQGPNPTNRALIKKGKFAHRDTEGRQYVMTEAEPRVTQPHGTKKCQQSLKAGKGVEQTDAPLKSPEGTTPADILNLDFWFPEP